MSDLNHFVGRFERSSKGFYFPSLVSRKVGFDEYNQITTGLSACMMVPYESYQI